MIDPKIAKRIDDLVRLASDSGASEGERSNASREVVRLMSAHRVELAPAPPKTVRAKRRPTRETEHSYPTASQPDARTYGSHGWREDRARLNEVCAMCGRKFEAGTDVWRRQDGRAIHGDGDWAEYSCGQQGTR